MNDEKYLVDGKYGITDLVDVVELRRIFQCFTDATGFTIGFLDHPGLNILIDTGWRDICTKFHRCAPVSADHCVQSNRHLLDRLTTPGALEIEKCENGLVDCAFPIIVKGKHIASLATGQLLLEPPDRDWFRKQAITLGFDEQTYMKALDEVPVISEEKLLSTTKFLGEMALLLSQLGYSQLVIKEGSLQLANEIAVRMETEETLRQNEEQLRQAQKLESVGRLAGGVAHDFNNMLGVILGYAEMAIEHAPALPVLQEDLNEICLSAKRSAELTRKLLAFASKQTIAPKVLNLNDTVASTLGMVKRLIRENINLNWIPDETLGLVRVDASQLDQILTNLCINARDAISEVGTITIAVQNCTVDEADCLGHPEVAPGEFVQLSVKDDGCGMDAETILHIFEPFYTTKDVGQGLGLGLATVYGAVKQNNGFIRVESELGRGTTFWIYFPRYSGGVEIPQAEVPAPPLEHGKKTILLVEDHLSLLTVTKRVLERQGYVVLAANSAAESCRLAQEHQDEIDLLMTDVIMPETNGLELAAKLKALFPKLKCLFMSGYTADVIAKHGVLDEGVNFIQKPFLIKDLAAKVRQVIGS